jgi:hypothetical protein
MEKDLRKRRHGQATQATSCTPGMARKAEATKPIKIVGLMHLLARLSAGAPRDRNTNPDLVSRASGSAFSENLIQRGLHDKFCVSLPPVES